MATAGHRAAAAAPPQQQGTPTAPSALREYATEALRQHAYKRLAMAQIGEFGRAFEETRLAARQAMERSALAVIEVPLPERPGASLYVQRVRRRAPGSLTQRRLEEVALKPLTAEDAQRLRQIAADVQRELEAAAGRAAQKQEAETRKRQRAEAAEARRAEAERKRQAKAERDAARRERQAAEAALRRRVQQGVRQLQRAEDDA
jgi:colicin import membrane protein